MLSPNDQDVAQDLKQKLLEITPLLNLVVYGSRARGEALLDSDMDIFLEVPTVNPDIRRRISEAAWEVGFENDIVISTFVVTPRDIREGPVGANPLVKAVKTEGVLV